jgi:predicted SAM-dependent methyltransferase
MTSLHLGSGLDYRPGTVNVDLYDLTAADVQADAIRLPFAKGSVARIKAHHLVEHLGYAGAIYALAEWQRVLGVGGTLLVETPDRTPACLAASESDPPAPALHWLFGLPGPGHGHLTLFDAEELMTLAARAGFAQLCVSQVDGVRSCLRLTGCKTGDRQANLWHRLHTEVVAAGILDPITAPPFFAHLETIFDQVISAAEALPESGEDACLSRVLGATARRDPRVTKIAIQILVAEGLVSQRAAAPYLDLGDSLVHVTFPARMAACLREEPALPGTQATRLGRLDGRVSLYLTAKLYPGEAALQSVREWFDATSASMLPVDGEITFFCADAVTELSRRETARGVRDFSKNGYEIARDRLEIAIAYDADNPWPRWNLARLALVEGQRLEALEQYVALLELMPGAKEVLRPEMDAVTGRAPDQLDRFLGPVQADHRGRAMDSA